MIRLTAELLHFAVAYVWEHTSQVFSDKSRTVPGTDITTADRSTIGSGSYQFNELIAGKEGCGLAYKSQM